MEEGSKSSKEKKGSFFDSFLVCLGIKKKPESKKESKSSKKESKPKESNEVKLETKKESKPKEPKKESKPKESKKPKEPKEEVIKEGKQEELSKEELAEQEAAENQKLYEKWQKEVDKHAKRRGELLDQASAAYNSGEKAKAKELSDQAKEEGRLMEEAQKKATREIFKAKNAKYKDKLTMDLHGLQVEGAMELFKERIEYWEKNKKGEPIQLVVITGAGNHSDKKKGPKIKPTVLNWLKENNKQFTELNNGSVQITI